MTMAAQSAAQAILTMTNGSKQISNKDYNFLVTASW
jgi:hypothetical protein